MDSLNNLRDSLDSSARQNPIARREEEKLGKDFKVAALHLTALYRTALSSSRSSHTAGYVQALSDVLELLQVRSSSSNSSTSPSRDRGESVTMEDENDLGIGTSTTYSSSQHQSKSRRSSQNEMRGGFGRDGISGNGELRWLMRYLQARIEAMRSDEEDEEREGGNGGVGLDGDNDSQIGSQQPQRRSSDLHPTPSSVASSIPSTSVHLNSRSSSSTRNASGTTTPTPISTNASNYLPQSRARTATEASSVTSTPNSQSERIRYSNLKIDSDPLPSTSISSAEQTLTSSPKGLGTRDFNFSVSAAPSSTPSGLAAAATTSNRNSSPFGSPSRAPSTSTPVFQNASTSPFTFKVQPAACSSITNSNKSTGEVWSTNHPDRSNQGSRELSPVNESIQSPFHFQSGPQEVKEGLTSTFGVNGSSTAPINRLARANKGRNSLGKTGNASSGASNSRRNHHSHNSGRSSLPNPSSSTQDQLEEEDVEREDKGNGRRGALPLREDEEMVDLGTSADGTAKGLRSRKKKRRESGGGDGNGSLNRQSGDVL